MIIKRNAPIIDGDGKVVARFASDSEVIGDHLEWTWFYPKTVAEFDAGPPRDQCNKSINHGLIYVAYAEGEFFVYRCSLCGDVNNAFKNDMFVSDAQSDGNVWRKKLDALALLSDEIGQFDKSYVCYLKEKFTYLATQEEKRRS